MYKRQTDDSTLGNTDEGDTDSDEGTDDTENDTTSDELDTSAPVSYTHLLILRRMSDRNHGRRNVSFVSQMLWASFTWYWACLLYTSRCV